MRNSSNKKSLTHSLSRSLTQTLTDSLIYYLTYTITYSLITHSLTYPLLNSLTDSPSRLRIHNLYNFMKSSGKVPFHPSSPLIDIQEKVLISGCLSVRNWFRRTHYRTFLRRFKPLHWPWWTICTVDAAANVPNPRTRNQSIPWWKWWKGNSIVFAIVIVVVIPLKLALYRFIYSTRARYWKLFAECNKINAHDPIRLWSTTRRWFPGERKKLLWNAIISELESARCV